MARTEYTRAGWEIFKASGFTLTLDEINERLRAVGYGTVRRRSMQHYDKLRRRGFQRYITMNRLDLMDVPDPFQDESIQDRYYFSDANVPTSLVVHRPDATLEVTGVATSLSDAGAEIAVDDQVQVDALRESPPDSGTPVTVNFLSPPGVAYGHIDFLTAIRANRVNIQVAFRELTPVQELIGGTALPVQVYDFVVGGAEGRQLDVVSQDVYWLFQAVESARAIFNELLRGMSTDTLYSPAPTVESLSVASPMKATLHLSIHVYVLMKNAIDRAKTTADRIRGVATTAVGITKAEAEARHLDAKSQKELAIADYVKEQTKGLRLDNKVKAAKVNIIFAVGAEVVDLIEESGQQMKQAPGFNVGKLIGLINDLDKAAGQLETRGIQLRRGPDQMGEAS
jgi:hypothetical protein